MGEKTRTGMDTSGQISKIKAIANLDSQNFQREGGATFLLKNDSTNNINIEVKLALDDEFVTTTFAPGWNPELIKEIKSDAGLAGVNLKWGE